METRIIFNGKTCTKIEEMPSEVRQAYEQALAQFADANKNGIPDIFEALATGNVISIQQSSISFNGREYKNAARGAAAVRVGDGPSGRKPQQHSGRGRNGIRHQAGKRGRPAAARSRRASAGERDQRARANRENVWRLCFGRS
jgi:hypothetical protein